MRGSVYRLRADVGTSPAGHPVDDRSDTPEVSRGLTVVASVVVPALIVARSAQRGDALRGVLPATVPGPLGEQLHPPGPPAQHADHDGGAGHRERNAVPAGRPVGDDADRYGPGDDRRGDQPEHEALHYPNQHVRYRTILV